MSLLLQSTEVQGYGLNGPDKQIARMTALLAGINVSEFRTSSVNYGIFHEIHGSLLQNSCLDH